MNAYAAYRPSGVEWLGNVPGHWEIRRLKDVGHLIAGAAFPEALQGLEGEELPFFKVADLHKSRDGRRLEDPEHTISREAAAEIRARVIPQESVVYAKIGAALLLNRRRVTTGPACIDNNMSAYVPDRDRITTHWALYTLSLIDFGENVNPGAVPSLSEGDQAILPLPIPPLDEQRAIAEYLNRETERIDALVEKKRQLIERLQEYRTALITRTVTRGLPPDAARAAGLDPSPRLKPSGVEWLGDVPEHWEVIENRRLFTERDERSDDGEGELLTVSHITGVTRRSEKPGVGMFMAESLEGYKLCYTGDFVVNTMWAWMGATGTAREAGLVSPSYNVYTPDPRKLLQRFVDLTYRSARYVVGMTSESRGIWTSRLRLYPQQFLSLVTAIPPMEEQQAIISHVDQIESESLRIITAVEAAIERLQEYRTALITATVTGKVDVRELVAAGGS